MPIKAEVIHFQPKNIDSPCFQAAKKLCLILKNNGFQAFIVGGYVRKLFLSSDAPSYDQDIDISTSAQGTDIKKIFKEAFCINKKLYVYLVKINGHGFEITSFRSESQYNDGRRPSQANYASMEKDSLRRDFTINAMYFDPNRNLVYDYHNGIKDLGGKVLRCVGVPDSRFNEDYLRIIRLFRFSINLNFSIEKTTLFAAKSNKFKILNISKERVCDEIRKISNNKLYSFFIIVEKELSFFKILFDVELKTLITKLSYTLHDTMRHYPCLAMYLVIFLNIEEKFYLSSELQRKFLLWPMKREEKKQLNFTWNLLKIILESKKLSKTDLDFEVFKIIYKTSLSLQKIDTILSIVIKKIEIEVYTIQKIKKLTLPSLSLKDFIHSNLKKNNVQQRSDISSLEEKSKADIYMHMYYRAFVDTHIH